MSARESELLAHIYRRSASLAGHGGIIVGPGDDAAVIDIGGQMIVTIDQLIEGRHFDGASTDVTLIARKAVARSVSDIAAMGGTPTCGLATGCLPDGYAHANELFDAMAHWAHSFGCPLIGGDIASSPGPMMLTVTVLGKVHQVRGPVLRSTARIGDDVYMTGRLGGAVRSDRHLTFEPRLAEAAWLCDTLGDALGAMIDISDGLGRDAGRIATASNVRLLLEAKRFPLHEDAGTWEQAAREGEDYELIFTVQPGVMVPHRVETTGTAISQIGRIIEGAGCGIIQPDNSVLEADSLGWDHGG